LLERVCNAPVESLSTSECQRGDEASPFGFVDRIDQVVLGKLPECIEEVEIKVSTDERGRGENVPGIRLQLLESVFDSEADTFRDVEIVVGQIAPSASSKEAALLRELMDDFFEEEGVAFRCFVESPDECSWRRAFADRCEQTSHVGFAEVAHGD
jgi:hypothetical protein